VANIADSWKAIIERMRAFAEGHEMIPGDVDGNKNFTHGPHAYMDKGKSGAYPLMHVKPVSATFDPFGKRILFSMEIVFAEKPHEQETASEFMGDALSDTTRLAADLIATIHNSTYELFDRSIKIDSATAEAFFDADAHVLTGCLLSLTLSVPSSYSFCDVPADFNLNTGDSGGGGNYSVKYWKIFEVSGEDNVVATEPADTVTFVGAGVTITTDATTKTITFTVPTYATTAYVDETKVQKMSCQMTISSMQDSQSYFFGMNPNVAVIGSGTRKIYFREAGTITGSELYWISTGVAGSNESVPISIRLNNTTDYSIASVATTAAEKVFSNTSMSIPILSGDYIEFKIATPAWATNPTNVSIGGYFNFKRT